MKRHELKNLRARVAKEPTTAARVRMAAGHCRRFSYADISNLTLDTPKKKIMATICDFIKAGEVRRLSPGWFEYIGRQRPRTLLDIIWHLIRSHRQFSTDEIERLSGAQRATVSEYLTCLRQYGYLIKTGIQHWRLVGDPGPETPVNTAKCQKLKRIRKSRVTSDE